MFDKVMASSSLTFLLAGSGVRAYLPQTFTPLQI